MKKLTLYSPLVAVCLTALPLLAAEKIPGIGPTSSVTKVQGDFQFTEGPALTKDGSLYFTDIPANRIYKLATSGKLGVFLEPSGHANGLMQDAQGRLVACQMDGQVVAIDLETKQVTPIVETYNDKRFNAPNDLVIDKLGGIYFTDPLFRAPEPLPQRKMGVYYLPPGGKAKRLVEDLAAPNGIILSPDEDTLYVIPSRSQKMMAYPVTGPGILGEGHVFCELRQPAGEQNTGGDGLTVDMRGNLYITSGLGIQIFNAQGKYLGVIEFPEKPANVSFGGPQRKTLYVTARTSLYSVEMESQGHVFATGK